MSDGSNLNDCLRCIIKDGFIEPVSSGGSIELKEKEADMTLSIMNLPQSTITIRMKKVGHLSCIRQDRGITQICDYLIIYESDGKCNAVFIEMKKTLRQNEQKPLEQLRCSLPVLDYLRALCKAHCGATPRIVVKYAHVAERMCARLDKQRTRIGPPSALIKRHRGIQVRQFITPKISIDRLVD